MRGEISGPTLTFILPRPRPAVLGASDTSVLATVATVARPLGTGWDSWLESAPYFIWEESYSHWRAEHVIPWSSHGHARQYWDTETPRPRPHLLASCHLVQLGLGLTRLPCRRAFQTLTRRKVLTRADRQETSLLIYLNPGPASPPTNKAESLGCSCHTSGSGGIEPEQLLGTSDEKFPITLHLHLGLHI